MIKWFGITNLAAHKLLENTALKCCCCNYFMNGQWSSYSPATVYPCKSFLNTMTNYNLVNATYMYMLHWSKHNVMLPENGWLLLSNSLTDRTLQYCWLITMISRSACFTSYPFISNQWLWMIQSRPTSSTCYD